ncbi:hypothetical protein KJ991_01155 [Patescibacteria group bacterium]|nr:hypothetical protein [Patescibacteria group bacterium]MBU4115912.1 hypothetical protein [Patescibacteria group bacterium]
MSGIKEEFFKYFSEKFNLSTNTKNEKVFRFVAKELIQPETINEAIEKFFKEREYSTKKILVGGFLFLKGKEKVFVTITNSSGRFPFLIFISIED